MSELAGSGRSAIKESQASGRSFHIGGKSLFALVDALVLIGVLVASWLLLGAVTFPNTAFISVLLLLQLFSEIRHPHRAELSALDETATIFTRACIAFAVTGAMTLVGGASDSAGLVVVALSTLPVLIVGRVLSYSFEKSFRRQGHRLRTLVVGGGEVAERIFSALRFCPEFGLEVVGVVDDDSNGVSIRQTGVFLGVPNEIPRIISSHQIDTIIFAFSERAEFGSPDVTELMRGVLSEGTNVWVIPRFYQFGVQGKRFEDLWGLPVVKLVAPGPAHSEWQLKRPFDAIAAALGILLLSPLLALCAALILVESGRPILFRQRRVGAKGCDFSMLKFRTMAICTDEINETEWVADRERTTKVGRLLRSSGLDELPQLLNVLRGEMSLVGPRPERPFFVSRFASLYSDYAARHRVPGGITGWSQIRGLRGNTSIEHRAAADNYYIDTWRFSADLKIILKSVPSVLRGQETNNHVIEDETPLIIPSASETQASSIDLTVSDPNEGAGVGTMKSGKG